MLEVEQGQALGEQFSIDYPLAEPRNDTEADPPGQFVERGADAAKIVAVDVLQAISKYHPVDAASGVLGALGAAVPDQLGVEARPGDLVILGVDLADQVEVD